MNRYEPRWRPFRPYNYPAALDGMGTIAAPLLASVSIALIAVLLSSAPSFRLLTAALLLLLIAAVSFIAAIECTFRARQYVVTPSELEDWWPDHETPGRRRALRREQRFYRSEFRRWAVRARTAYDIGILTLTLGVVALLVPHGHIDAGRWVVLAVGIVAVGGQAAWIINARRPQLPVSLEDVAPEPPSSDAPSVGASGSL